MITFAFIFGGLVIFAGLSVLNLCLNIELMGAGFVICLPVSIVLGGVMAFLIGRVSAKTGKSGKRMLLCFSLPALIAGFVLMVVGFFMPRGDLFSGRFMAGVVEFLLGAALFGSALMVLISAAFGLFLIGKKQPPSSTDDRDMTE